MYCISYEVRNAHYINQFTIEGKFSCDFQIVLAVGVSKHLNVSKVIYTYTHKHMYEFKKTAASQDTPFSDSFLPLISSVS